MVSLQSVLIGVGLEKLCENFLSAVKLLNFHATRAKLPFQIPTYALVAVADTTVDASHAGYLCTFGQLWPLVGW